MSGLRIGALRHRVRLEAAERIAAEGGAAAIVWNTVATLYARIDTSAGREIAFADGIQGRITHRIVIRARTDIGPQMRFAFGTRIFDIHATRLFGCGERWTECLCEEALA